MKEPERPSVAGVIAEREDSSEDRATEDEDLVLSSFNETESAGLFDGARGSFFFSLRFARI